MGVKEIIIVFLRRTHSVVHLFMWMCFKYCFVEICWAGSSLFYCRRQGHKIQSELVRVIPCSVTRTLEISQVYLKSSLSGCCALPRHSWRRSSCENFFTLFFFLVLCCPAFYSSHVTSFIVVTLPLSSHHKEFSCYLCCAFQVTHSRYSRALWLVEALSLSVENEESTGCDSLWIKQRTGLLFLLASHAPEACSVSAWLSEELMVCPGTLCSCQLGVTRTTVLWACSLWDSQKLLTCF